MIWFSVRMSQGTSMALRARYPVNAMLVLLAALSASILSEGPAEAQPRRPDSAVTRYRTINVDGIDVFYREAGAVDAPAILLLHGFPTSSHMFRNLIPALALRYRVIAPDYPAFGQSAAPDRHAFRYTFARFAELMDGLLNQLGIERYAMYVQDYGAPVGFRLALKHPERVTALVVQNGNAYQEGLKEFWNPIKAYWADGSEAHRAALRAGLTLEATRSQYLDGVRDPSRISPDTWRHDQALLDRPGIDEIMLDLFKDYGTNVGLYPQFQAFFRSRRPPTLIVWGRHDVIFPADGAHAYLRAICPERNCTCSTAATSRWKTRVMRSRRSCSISSPGSCRAGDSTQATDTARTPSKEDGDLLSGTSGYRESSPQPVEWSSATR